MDEWTPKQLEYMRAGGNDHFTQFLHSYNLDEESPEVKYKSKAADYYRKRVLLLLTLGQLRATAESLVFPADPPAFDEGREEIPDLPKFAPPAEPAEYS
jgi:hypothetical protein